MSQQQNQADVATSSPGQAAHPSGSGGRGFRSLFRRRLRRGGQSVALTVSVLGILVLLNVIAGRAGWQLDLSAEGRFTLSPQSHQVVRQLAAPVQVTAFVRDGSGILADLLGRYAQAGDRFRLRLVDPVKEPSVARQYEVTQYDTVILEQGSRMRRIEPDSLYAVGPSRNEVEFRGEQAVTRALVELGREQSMTIYFLTGHGEATPNDRLARLAGRLEGDGYTVGTLNLAQAGEVPDDASLLVASGPRSDLDVQEREAIEAYLDRGGRLMVLVDPSDREIAGWNALLEGLGVQLRRDVVVDPVQSFFLDPLAPMPTLRYHDITRELQERQMRVMLPRARSLARVTEEVPYTVTTLLETSFDAWGETTLQGTAISKGSEDVAGPLMLAAAISRPVQAPAAAGDGDAVQAMTGAGSEEGGAAGAEPVEGGRRAGPEPVAVVMGNASFLEGDVLGVQGNEDFFLNAVNWLVGEEHLISIRPKTLGTPTVDLTRRLIEQVFYGFVVALPLAVLALGAVIWWRRRAL